MLTKCPKCGKSDQVRSLNLGKRAIAATTSFIAGAATKIIAPSGSPSTMKEVYKNICPEREYYCKRCKLEFSERTF